MAATPDQTPQAQPDQQQSSFPAAGAALALAGLAGAGAIPIAAPVYIPADTARNVVAATAEAASVTAQVVSKMAENTVASMLKTRYPDVADALDLSDAARRAKQFPVQSAKRMRKGMAEAVKKPTRKMILDEIDRQVAQEMDKPDFSPLKLNKLARARNVAQAQPGPRERAVAQLIENEKRYAMAHAAAQVDRVAGAANQKRLERTSPEGAYWKLGDGVVQHTKGCLQLAGRSYPHSVLKHVRPPLHFGCQCSLVGIPEAIDAGLMAHDDVPSQKVALRHVKYAIALEESVEGSWLIEGLFDKRLHPRGPGGRWVESFMDRIHGKGTVLGVTPYWKDYDPDHPRQTSKSASALRDDPGFQASAERFEKSARELAKKHKVRLVKGERMVGVFESAYEPSYAIKVRGKAENIDAFNQELGRAFNQDAVVSFRDDPKGKDIEARFQVPKDQDPDEFYKRLKDAFGDYAGASYDDGVWRVFVEGQKEYEHESYEDAAKRVAGEVSKLGAIAKQEALPIELVTGSGTYRDLKS